MIRGNIGQEAEQFFKELGMEDTISKLSDMFIDNFMIQGEETEDLKEALHRAPDGLVDLIWDKIEDKETVGETDRQQKEKILFEDIPEYLKAKLILMDPLKLKLLICVMNGYSVEMEETAGFFEEFIPYGWVFSFCKDGQCSFTVMNELREVIMTIEEPEIKTQMEFIFCVRCIINTCIGLYGVCKQEQVQKVYENFLEIDESQKEEIMDDYGRIMPKVISCLEEDGLFWLDGEYLISPYLEDKMAYKRLLRSRQKDYFMPDENVVESYCLGKMVEKNEEYETVLKLLTKEIRDREQAEEMLEEISAYVIREDWEIPQVLDCLYDWAVNFNGLLSFERMMTALGKWLYGIRRWSECGYSRKERNKENLDLKYITNINKKETERNVAPKIYPNDPCPCGSGKKYKKCCGRK